MASFRVTFRGREALPRSPVDGNRVTNVRTGRRKPGDDSSNGNVSSKLLITINHRATRVTNSRRRGITARLSLSLSVPPSRLLSPRGNLRRLPPHFSRLLGTALLRNIPLARATQPSGYGVCDQRRYILRRDTRARVY